MTCENYKGDASSLLITQSSTLTISILFQHLNLTQSLTQSLTLLYFRPYHPS